MMKVFCILIILKRENNNQGILFQSFNQTRQKKNREKIPGLQKKNIVFHQDNAPAHKIVLAMGK
jgi:hypothetical protein